jgi:hypothetical protein
MYEGGLVETVTYRSLGIPRSRWATAAIRARTDVSTLSTGRPVVKRCTPRPIRSNMREMHTHEHAHVQEMATHEVLHALSEFVEHDEHGYSALKRGNPTFIQPVAP